MAFKAKSTSGVLDYNKRYFFHVATLGNGLNEFRYVTPDAPGVWEVSGYFDDDELRAVLKPGDKIEVIQVAAISDERSIEADIAAGFVDVNITYVVTSDGSGINVSPAAIAGSIEYTLP